MLFALSIAYLAIQNTLGVTLVVANNVITNVPLYVVVLGAVIVGIIMSTIINGLDAVAAYRRLRGKDHIIQEDRKAIHDLEEKVKSLEVQNMQLKTETGFVEEDVHGTEDTGHIHRPSFFHSLFHPRTETR